MDEGLVKIRHERSKKDFPFLKLEDDEYVEYAFQRAKICLMAILVGGAGGMILVLLAFLIGVLGQSTLDAMGKNFMFTILFAVLAAILLAMIVSFVVYRGNRLFVTNKHVIQMVMKSPVATSINMIDLPSIEDASFHQNGLLQKLFGFGTLRLSTVGDETTYTFAFSDIAPDELKAISKLITNSKKEAKKED